MEEELRIVAEEARRQLTEPPTAEELEAYRTRRLPADEMDRIEHYLALSPETADILIGAQDPSALEITSGPFHVDREELDEQWQAFQRRTAAVPAPVAAREKAVAVPTERWRARRLFDSVIFLRTAAAVLLATTLGFAGMAFLGDTADPGQTDIEVNPPLAFGSAVQPRSGSGISAVPVRYRPEARFVTFLLAFPQHDLGQEYRIRITDSDGRQIIAGGLKPSPQGNLSLRLSCRLLSPGRYQFEVLPPSGETAVASYFFDLATVSEPASAGSTP